MTRNRYMVSLVLLTFFVISLLTNIINAIIPDIISSFRVSLMAAGFLVFAFFIAYGVMSIPAGFLVEQFTEKPVMIVSFLAATLGSLSFALFPRYNIAVMSLFAIGAGMATLQVAINPLLRVAGGEEHYAFNSALAQLVFGSASFISPRIYSYLVLNLNNASHHQSPLLRVLGRLTPRELPWASIYWVFAVCALLMMVVLVLSRFPAVQHTAEERAGSLDMYRSLMRQPVVWLYFVAMFAYTGCEQGTANWISNFLHEYHGFDPHTTGAAAVSWFWRVRRCAALSISGLVRSRQSFADGVSGDRLVCFGHVAHRGVARAEFRRGVSRFILGNFGHGNYWRSHRAGHYRANRRLRGVAKRDGIPLFHVWRRAQRWLLGAAVDQQCDAKPQKNACGECCLSGQLRIVRPAVGLIFLSGQRTILHLLSRNEVRRAHDSPHNFHRARHSVFGARSLNPANECTGVLPVEADAEDRGLGLLRCEDAASTARQVGRHGGDSDANHEQSEAAGRGGPATGAGRAIAARHHRSSEGQRTWRAHSHGPIYIEGAETGDVLEVKILAIKLAIPYAYNAFGPGRGYLPDDYPYAKIKIIPLDEKRMVAKFAPGIEIPLHPFFGSMGDAPPESAGRFNSAPPWIMAGNLDNKDLVAGTTLYIPVHAPGALFEVGDGHAGQGDGEVDITALETSLIGTFQFIVRKDMHLKWPRTETPTHYITMGLNDDLNACATLAVREMIDFLVTEKHLSRDDAYMLASVAADLHITELVDGNKGVHMMIPKSIFVGSAK